MAERLASPAIHVSTVFYVPLLPKPHGLMELFRDRVLPFDTDAARRYAELAVIAKTSGRGFPTPDGYIAAIAVSRGGIVASRDTAPYEAAGVSFVNPWFPTKT